MSQLFDLFAAILSWFYDVWPSYAGSIALFTLLIMVIMAPVTVRQTRSMLAMQRLQPEVKRLREKYGDDRDRLNQEMMALYQANGVNPLGGCLPILIQMPVFLVLFRLVQGLTRRVSDIGLYAGNTVSRAGEAVPDFPQRTFNPEFVDRDHSLFLDLSGSTEMNSLGLDLSISPSSALSDSFLTGLPYLLMVILVGVTSWLQQRQIQGRSTNANVNPQQQAIMKILPFMLPVFSFGFPAALIVYFLVSNVFRVGQQMFITKKVYGGPQDDSEIVRPEPVKAEAKGGTKTSPAPARKGQGSSTNHGSRRPVTNPPKKRKKKPEPSTGSGPRKGKTNETREPKARPQSKRVTPKKSDQRDTSDQRRRNRKKR